MPFSRKQTVIDTERKSRIQQALLEANLDAVICALPSDVLLLTGYWPVIGASVAICFLGGPTILLVPEDEKELSEDGFADSIITFTAETLDEMQSITDAVKPLLTGVLQRHVGRGTIGIESASSSQAASYLAIHLFGNNLAEVARVALPHARLTPCERWVRDLKSVKTRLEIEKIRTACGIARNSFETGASGLRPGMDEPEAGELFRAALQRAKPSARDSVRCDGFVFCMSGPNAAKASAAYAQTRYRSLERDDTVMIHCNSYVDGFWTDVTRTYSFRPPDEQQQKMRAAVLAAREAAFACIKPGARAADVDAASRRTISNFGLSEYVRHGTGHGVGFSPMSAYSIPQLHMKSPDVLREGMVFNVEPAVYVDGYGGIRHCDMVAVTAAGYELLTDFQSDASTLTLPDAHSGHTQFVKAGTRS